MKTQVMVVFFTAVCINVGLSASNYHWIGPDSGTWSDPDNWSPPGYPGMDIFDTVEFATDPSTPLSVIVDISRSVQSITCTGNIILKGLLSETGESACTLESMIINTAALDIRAVELVGGIINMSGAVLKLREITGSIQLENEGALTWYMTNILDDPSFINNYGLMTVRNPSVLVSYGSMMNTGTVNIENSNLAFYDDATFLNEGTVYGSGYLVSETALSNSGTINSRLDDLVVAGPGEFINEGQLYNEPGTHLAVSVMGPYPVRNFGEIEAYSGGGVSIYCYPLINEDTGYIHLAGGFLRAGIQTEPWSFFEGRGELIGSIDIAPNAVADFYQTLTITCGLTIQASAEITFQDAAVLVEGAIQNEGTIHLKSSRLIPRGGISGGGQVSWEISDYNSMTDFNFDGIVNMEDLAAFSQTWLWESPL